MAKEAKEMMVTEEGTLLRFLLEHIKNLSRNSVKTLLSTRQISLNGRVTTRFDEVLCPGDRVSVAAAGATGRVPDFKILFEDEDLLVVDKPAGLLSIATEGEKVKTAYHQATDYVGGSDGKGRVYVVHRLDRDTSGVLLFAKSETMKRQLQDDWEQVVEKRGYLAIVEGKPPEAQGVIRSFFHETATHLVYSGSQVDGKEAITRYEVLASNEKYSLVSLLLETGRKNQIRVHMKDLNCPVAGDKKYGSKTNPLGRLCLHAQELWLTRPDTKESLRFTAPTPRGFQSLPRKERAPGKARSRQADRPKGQVGGKRNDKRKAKSD